MCEVTPFMVSVATKHGISVIYHSLLWYISYIPQCGAFDLDHWCGICNSCNMRALPDMYARLPEGHRPEDIHIRLSPNARITANM